MHYRPKATDEVELWPPKYWKFALETEEEPKVEAAFTDARRFARGMLFVFDYTTSMALGVK